MKAFTLVELLIVIGVSSVLVGISAGVYITLDRRSSVDTEARKVESILNLARSRALASEGEQSYGVRIVTGGVGEYILFPGDAYIASNPDNEKFEIHPKVSLGLLELNGGGSDIVFERLTGGTSQFGSLVLREVGDPSNIATLCIDGTGVIEIRSACTPSILAYSGGTIDGDIASFPANSGFGDPSQSFTTGIEDIFVGRTELYLRRTALDPSDVFLEIRQQSTTGSVLGRSWTVDGASLRASLGWVSFIFPSPVLLLANTQYFLRLRSLPASTIAFSGAQGFIYWGYEHSAFVPPAYAGGDAWRYVGRNNTPTDQGQRLGPVDQYDFSFRIIYGVDPPSGQDSRHPEFDLLDSSGRGWSIRGASTLRLVFHDPPNADVAENVSMARFFNGAQTTFNWEGTINVNGDPETLRIHAYYIDTNNTTLSIHRDRDFNQKAVDISIDGKAIVSYAAAGTPQVGAWGGVMIYR